jgi:hypothetical protein
MEPAKIEARQKEFQTSFTNKLKQHKIGKFAQKPSTLYHYTTAIGLNGILESRCIYATHFRYVNDLTEFVYANEILQVEILKRIHGVGPLVEATLNAILSTPDYLSGAIDIFIACFCKKGDLLSQWRAYGGGGGGYAIGLKWDDLDPHLIGRGYDLYRVNYNVRSQHMLVGWLLDEFCKAVEYLGSGIDPSSIASPAIYTKTTAKPHRMPIVKILSKFPEPIGELCINLAFAFLELACCFKSPSFASEDEWRLVQKRFSDGKADFGRAIQLRIAGATFIPYVELPLSIKGHHAMPDGSGNVSLEKIVYGPGLNPQVTERSLQILTARMKHKVVLKRSSIKVKV